MKENNKTSYCFKIIHNEFPKFCNIPKNVLDLLISNIEFEIRDYYKDKITKPKVPL